MGLLLCVTIYEFVMVCVNDIVDSVFVTLSSIVEKEKKNKIKQDGFSTVEDRASGFAGWLACFIVYIGNHLFFEWLSILHKITSQELYNLTLDILVYKFYSMDIT